MTRVMERKTAQKLIVQTLTGAAFGAAGTFLFLKFGGRAADFDDPARLGPQAKRVQPLARVVVGHDIRR